MENMKKGRRKFSSSFKAKVAIEALKEQMTLAELSAKFDVHQNQISKWKQEFLNNSERVFDSKIKPNSGDKEDDVSLLYQKIGQLEMERDFLKKSIKKLESL